MSDEARIFCEGTCHCGDVGARLHSANNLGLRACQCGFCRRHGAGTVADPDGSLSLYADEESLNRYRFDPGTADFILCQSCGTYIAAVITSEGEHRATLNVMGIDPAWFQGMPIEPVSYDGERVSDRRARRLSTWTPTHFHPRRDYNQTAAA